MHLFISFVHRAFSFSYHPWLPSSSSSGRSNALRPHPHDQASSVSHYGTLALLLLFVFLSSPASTSPTCVPPLLIRVSTSAYDERAPQVRSTTWKKLNFEKRRNFGDSLISYPDFWETVACTRKRLGSSWSSQIFQEFEQILRKMTHVKIFYICAEFHGNRRLTLQYVSEIGFSEFQEFHWQMYGVLIANATNWGN